MSRIIVFPTNTTEGLGAKRGAHFGRAKFYTVVALDDDGEVRRVTTIQNPGHTAEGCGGAVANICALEADALVVSGIGGNPLKGFMQRGMAVFHDGVSATVEASLAALRSGKLAAMRPEMTCSHHTH